MAAECVCVCVITMLTARWVLLQAYLEFVCCSVEIFWWFVMLQKHQWLHSSLKVSCS